MNRYVILFVFSIIGFNSIAQDSKTFREYLFSYNFTNKYAEGKQFKGSLEVKTNRPHQLDHYNFFGAFQNLVKKSDEYINFRNFRPRYWLLGFGYYYSDNLNSQDRYEVRLIQGTAFFAKLDSTTSIKNYIRIEERFQRTLGDGAWSDGYRIRYKISTAIPLSELTFDLIKIMYIPVSLEAFMNVRKSDQFNDVVRFSFGLGYKINPRWKIEADLVYKRTQDQSFNIDSNNYLFRLKLYHTLKKGKGLLFKDNELFDLIEDW